MTVTEKWYLLDLCAKRMDEMSDYYIGGNNVHQPFLEHNSISSCNRAKPWMFESVYIKGNQMKLFQ